MVLSSAQEYNCTDYMAKLKWYVTQTNTKIYLRKWYGHIETMCHTLILITGINTVLSYTLAVFCCDKSNYPLTASAVTLVLLLYNNVLL